MNYKRFIRSTIFAWIIFIGIDFLIHASILEKLWAENIAAIKPLLELAILIPIGYVSFLLLTILVGLVFVKVYREKPNLNGSLKFGFLFGFLYSLSNLLAIYSYLDVPLKNLILYNTAYFIEIVVVVFIYYKTYYGELKRKHFYIVVAYFLLLVIVGIVIQNIF